MTTDPADVATAKRSPSARSACTAARSGGSPGSTAPSNITISGDTEVLAPPAAPASSVPGCGSYASWYDAQVAYEAAGML
ncbi:MAG TPA: hypothetical protein PKD63_10090, partial [Solirubrobacteraceae bacterium]|nr:hypothetical protein [Solirubrobacteraceae bacterium]